LFALFQESETHLRRAQFTTASSSRLTLFELVAATPSLSTLGAAVVRAGLDGALDSPGTFTVFAPNNDAFGDVPSDIANTLFTNDAFLPHLTDLLLYHVLGTEISTNQHAMFDGSFLSPLNGESLAVTRPNLEINGNLIIARNIGASNGVANVIDGVLIPSWVSNSITDRVVADSDLSTLLALVGIAGLGGALAGPGELTLVAPINSAFAKLPASTVTFLTSAQGKATLTSILLYHVFPNIIVSSELSNGLTTKTLEGGTVTVSVNNRGIFFNDAKVVKADILANNGVVHKIDTVLDPFTAVEPLQPTITGYVVSDPDLSALTTAVVRAGLAGALDSDEVNLTLFAPTDDAFGKVPADVLDTLLNNDEFIPHLANLLLYHVLPSEVFAIDLSDDLVVSAANGEDLLITIPPIAVNGNKVMEADIDVSNGVIHIIDGVLFPSWVSNSITDRVVADSDLSTLLALVGLAGLGGALAGPGELTLVAPTNSAFAKINGQTIAFLTSPGGRATLTSILLYHVFPSIITSSELTDGLTTTSLEGSTVNVSVNNAGIFFNDSKVVAADILANNGVVHKIDTVLNLLMAPGTTEPTLFDLVAATPSLSTLEAALIRVEFDFLKANGVSVTVFAPNNDAFGKVPVDIANNLFTNDAFLPHLSDLLLYHVLGTKITINAMFDGQFLQTTNSESLAVTGPPLEINGNRVIASNIEASNGVANIIDGVLLPSWVSNSITDRVVADSDLSTLLALVGIAGLGGALAGPGELTLVAPVNSAFAKLPEATVAFLTGPMGKATLTSILLYHVFPDIIVSAELSNGLTPSTLEGGTVTVSVNNAGFFFNDAKVILPDILAINGVVHKIDTVLDPNDGR
jgi:uncharacterized surface protein with fasciclin (FAS1) repeats